MIFAGRRLDYIGRLQRPNVGQWRAVEVDEGRTIARNVIAASAGAVSLIDRHEHAGAALISRHDPLLHLGVGEATVAPAGQTAVLVAVIKNLNRNRRRVVTGQCGNMSLGVAPIWFLWLVHRGDSHCLRRAPSPITARVPRFSVGSSPSSSYQTLMLWPASRTSIIQRRTTGVS